MDALADDLAENDKVEDEDGRFYVIDMWSDDRRLNPGAAANNNDKKTIRTTTPQVFPLSVLLNMGLLPSNLVDTIKSAFEPASLGTTATVQSTITSEQSSKTSP